MKRRLSILALLSMLLSGCSIRFTSSKVVDGGIYRSENFGEQWQQKVFVRTEKKKTITISAVDVSGIYFSPTNADDMVITTYANGILQSSNAGESWQASGIRTGSVPAFAFDPVTPTIRYAGVGRNILKTTDNGTTWDTIYTDTRGEGITAVTVNASDARNILAFTSGGAILKSENYGVDWRVLIPLGDSVRQLVSSPTETLRLYAVTTKKGLQRSTDGGQTWKELDGLRQYPGAEVISWITFSPFFPDTLFVATNYGILKSVNGGDAWSPVKTLIPFGTVPIQTVAVDALDSKIVYFTVGKLLHKTDDGGITWKTIETVPTTRVIQRLVSHPSKAGVLYFGTLLPKKK